jgi:glutamate 5-kinase
MQKFDSIIVKIEFSSLTDVNGNLDEARMERMAMILSNLSNSGKHLILVTSGAIVLGSRRLKLTSSPESLISQQAAAAVGQAELIKIYQNKFEIFNQRVAQILLTNDVLQNEVRKQNALNTFNTLFEMNIIPVVNENDAVSTEDIEYMDNYPLTRSVALLSGSNMIIIRGETEGEYAILMRGEKNACKIESEETLIEEVERKLKGLVAEKAVQSEYPAKMEEITIV